MAGYGHVTVAAMPGAPADEDLEAAKAHLKHVETHEGASGVDPQVLAVYQKAYDQNIGGEFGLLGVCKAVGIDLDKYGPLIENGTINISSREEFTKKFLGV
eukprot:TRINITY_DN4291_c0_g2_i1.p1 TRINITY_DN4291_c0_g2~~TRINITY_DN4291_c0_g2_i1.p1  ORF type:complete len:101 (+),score=21.35 TRINITY_DN4291_c0_g2_i1:81-383(+)